MATVLQRSADASGSILRIVKLRRDTEALVYLQEAIWNYQRVVENDVVIGVLSGTKVKIGVVGNHDSISQIGANYLLARPATVVDIMRSDLDVIASILVLLCSYL
jgi:hypothetical protein